MKRKIKTNLLIGKSFAIQYLCLFSFLKAHRRQSKPFTLITSIISLRRQKKKGHSLIPLFHGNQNHQCFLAQTRTKMLSLSKDMSFPSCKVINQTEGNKYKQICKWSSKTCYVKYPTMFVLTGTNLDKFHAWTSPAEDESLNNFHQL